MVTVSRPPTAVDFSDESDPDEQVFPDKTDMARLKRRSRADQDQDRDQDEQPGSTIIPTMTMTTARPVAKKRKAASGSGSGLTPEEREKMTRTSERLKKDAQRLPVNEGEPERESGLVDTSSTARSLFLSVLVMGNEIFKGGVGDWTRVVFISILILLPTFSLDSVCIFGFRPSRSSQSRHPHRRIDRTSNSDSESELGSGSESQPGSQSESESISVAKDALVQHILDNETVVVSPAPGSLFPTLFFCLSSAA
jgi:hypothetical protein